MATASVTYTFVDATAAEAAEVNANFADLVGFLNADVVQADGSIAMSGRLSLASLDPTSADHAVRKAHTDKLSERVGLRRDTNLTLSTDGTYVPWTAEDSDPDGWHPASSDTLTCPSGQDGVYEISCQMTQNGVGSWILFELSSLGSYLPAAYTPGGSVGLSFTLEFAATDTLKVLWAADSGAAVTGTGHLRVHRVGYV